MSMITQTQLTQIGVKILQIHQNTGMGIDWTLSLRNNALVHTLSTTVPSMKGFKFTDHAAMLTWLTQVELAGGDVTTGLKEQRKQALLLEQAKLAAELTRIEGEG